MRLLKTLFLIVLIILLPYLAIIRVSTLIHNAWYPQAWLSLAGGYAAAAVILAVLLPMAIRSAGIFRRKKQRQQTNRLLLRVLLGIFTIVTAFSLIYISGSHVKNESIRQTYHDLHPVLRVSLSITVLIDPDLIITDLARTHSDYSQMGLTVKRNSLHYPQSDGYVHAADIRTTGRPEWRNKLAQWFFGLAGFHTLRHTGTADHLHISLSIAENPSAL